MPANKNSQINLGCAPLGCLPLIIFIFLLWSLWFGLPTPWGKFEIDLFWPGIYLNR